MHSSAAAPPVPAAPNRYSPASDRNKAPILDVLRGLLGASGNALEIASGSAQHLAHFAAALPGWRWQPSDCATTPDALAALDADISFYCSLEGAMRDCVLPAAALDVLQTPWPALPDYDLVYCANMLHIAPWACCAALFDGAMRHLRVAGLLVIYGPFFASHATAASAGNVAFDIDLRARNPAWGIRQLADVTRAAARVGLRLQQRHDMPSNNLCLVFGR